MALLVAGIAAVSIALAYATRGPAAKAAPPKPPLLLAERSTPSPAQQPSSAGALPPRSGERLRKRAAAPLTV
jgi:hypothetical protein